MPILDSGERREFSSGAVRDVDENKGRCDLLPLDVIAKTIEMLTGKKEVVLEQIEKYIRTGDELHIHVAINDFIVDRGWDEYTMLLELSKHFAEGCAKYGSRNWEKGIPLHCFVDSGVRHYLKWRRGDKDEPHDRAFLWNMFCALWTQKHKPEMIDLPFGENEAAT